MLLKIAKNAQQHSNIIQNCSWTSSVVFAVLSRMLQDSWTSRMVLKGSERLEAYCHLPSAISAKSSPNTCPRPGFQFASGSAESLKRTELRGIPDFNPAKQVTTDQMAKLKSIPIPTHHTLLVQCWDDYEKHEKSAKVRQYRQSQPILTWCD